MPAIQLARLRRQAAELAEHFHKPSAFTLELKYLLEFYSDRTRRPGKTGNPPPFLQIYNVPDPVMRRIFLEMEPLAAANPNDTFALVEALWEEPIYDLRLLANLLLGAIPASEHQQILDYLGNWVDENEEEGLLESMADQSLSRLRVENADIFILQVEKWLKSKVVNQQKLGLRALLAQLKETDFENLPVIYQLLEMYIPTASKGLRPTLLNLIKPLAQRSPLETAFFLRQSLEKSDNPIIPWLIRRSMDSFPDDVQTNLKVALKK